MTYNDSSSGRAPIDDEPSHEIPDDKQFQDPVGASGDSSATPQRELHRLPRTVRDYRAYDSSHRSFLSPGDQLGQFEIQRLIGRGGMGVVYEAVDSTLNRRVALKLLPPSPLLDELQMRRFKNEAEAAASLDHPNIVNVYTCGDVDGIQYYSMQLIEGRNIAQVVGSIRERLSTHRDTRAASTETDPTVSLHHTADAKESPNGELTVNKATRSRDKSIRSTEPWREFEFAANDQPRRQPQTRAKWFKSIASKCRDAAQAIGYAHDCGIIHRDIKPSNLMLDMRGKLWVTDFGLAFFRQNPMGTATGDIVGTYRYMSPEQASGRKFLMDHRTDIYSMGATLYEMLALQPAFSGNDPIELLRKVVYDEPLRLRKVNPQIPIELELIVNKAMSKNPHERYLTAHEFADDLDRFCNDQPIKAKPPTVLQRIRRWSTGHPTITGMLAVALGMVFLGTIAFSAALVEQNRQVTSEKEKLEDQLRISRGVSLLDAAERVTTENPLTSLRLGVEAAKLIRSPKLEETLQRALAENHEGASWQVRAEATEALDVSPDGTRVLSTVSRSDAITGNQPAVITDLQLGQTVAVFETGSVVTAAVFSPLGDRVLTLSPQPANTSEQDRSQAKSQLMVWDTSTKRPLLTALNISYSTLDRGMFSTKQPLLVTAGVANEGIVYDVRTLEPSYYLHGHEHPITKCVFSPSGDWIATSDSQGELRLWYAQDGRLAAAMPALDPEPLSLLEFTHDSRYIVTSTEMNPATRVYRIEEDKIALQAYWFQPTIDVSPVENFCAAAWPLGDSVSIRSAITGSIVSSLPIEDILFSSLERIRTAFSDDGSIAIGSGQVIEVYTPSSGERLYRLMGHRDVVKGVVYSATNKQWVSSSADKTVRVWNNASGRDRSRLLVESDNRASYNIEFNATAEDILYSTTMLRTSLFFNAHGQRLPTSVNGTSKSRYFSNDKLAVTEDGKLLLVEAPTGRVIHSSKIPGAEVLSLHSITVNVWLVMTTERSYWWEPDSKSLVPLVAKGEDTTAWGVTQDRSRFAIGTADGKCYVFDSTSGELLKTVQHSELITDIDFYNNEALLVVDKASTLTQWTLSDLSSNRLIEAGDLTFDNCLLLQDGDRLLTFHSLATQPVVCWDAKTWKEMSRTAGSSQMTLEHDPRSAKVFIGSQEDGLRAWDIESGEVSVLSSNAVLDLTLMNDQLVTIELPEGVRLNTEQWHTPSIQSRLLCSYSVQSGKEIFKNRDVPEVIGSRICVDPTSGTIVVPARIYTAQVINRESLNCRNGAVHYGPISFSCLFEDSSILSAGWDGRVGLLQNATGESFVDLKRPVVTAVRHGSLLACGLSDGTISLIDVHSLTEIGKLDIANNDDSAVQLLLSADGQRLIAVYTGGMVRVWHVTTGDSQDLIQLPETSQAQLIPNSNQLLVWQSNLASKDAKTQRGSLTLLNFITLQVVQQFQHDEPISSIASSPEGNRFFVASANGKIMEYHRPSARDEFLQDIDIKQVSGAYPVISSSKSGRFLAAQTGREILVWDLLYSNSPMQRFDGTRDGLFIAPESSSQLRTWSPFSDNEAWIGFRAGNAVEWRSLDPLAQAVELVRVEPINDQYRRYIGEVESQTLD